MRLIVVGAGASIGEAQECLIEESLIPPAMFNLSKVLWTNPRLPPFCPYDCEPKYKSPTEISVPTYGNLLFDEHYIARTPALLDEYLKANNIDFNEPLIKFQELEGLNNNIDIEHFFEFVWNQQSDYSMLRNKLLKQGHYNEFLLPLSWNSFWRQFTKTTLITSLSYLIQQGFFKATEFKKLTHSQKVVQKLNYGDVILNLNYDTLFEIALQQNHKRFNYSPWQSRDYTAILVAKPHGSLNFVTNSNTGTIHYGEPNFYGQVLTEEFIRGDIVPPRFNKTYQQHPFAKTIIDKIKKFKPHILTFWGIGFTTSDTDLLELYIHLAKQCQKIEVINRNPEIIDKVKSVLSPFTKAEFRFFPTIEEWA